MAIVGGHPRGAARGGSRGVRPHPRLGSRVAPVLGQVVATTGGSVVGTEDAVVERAPIAKSRASRKTGGTRTHVVALAPSLSRSSALIPGTAWTPPFLVCL